MDNSPRQDPLPGALFRTGFWPICYVFNSDIVRPAFKNAGRWRALLEQPEDRIEPDARSLRGYGGIRITAPRRGSASTGIGKEPAEPVNYDFRPSREQQARILTGSALLGVLAVVLLHELGHWVAGLIVTGQAPDFYGVAVRQQTTEFSTTEGVVTWLAGPAVQLAAVWALTLLIPASEKYAARLAAAAGAAILFSLALTAVTWALAATSSPSEWQDDLPKVASFFPSNSWALMFLLNGAFMAAVIAAGLRWQGIKGRLNSKLFAGPIAVGTVQGGVVVLAGSVLVALMV
jgi:hypothetical protein